jgi:hypothetical protein
MKNYLIVFIILVISMSFTACSNSSFQVDNKTGDTGTIKQVSEDIDENIDEDKDSAETFNPNETDNNVSSISNEKRDSSNDEETSVNQDELEEQQFNEKVERISKLVQPSIVYGTMKNDYGKFKKGEQVEIIKDESNGKSYYVSSNGKNGWISSKNISIPEDFETVEDRMNEEDMEFFVNQIKDFDSKTNYFVWIDLSRQLVNIFEGEKGNWQLMHSFLCATGKNVTPTIRGTFEVNGRGPRFGNSVGAKNWVRFYGNYLMHSITIDSRGNILDTTLGKRASHGCVRMSMEDSRWIYDNIPDGTTVWVN